MTFKDLHFGITSKVAKILDTGTPLEKVASGFWEEILGASAFQNGDRVFSYAKNRAIGNDIKDLISGNSTLTANEQAVLMNFYTSLDNRQDEWSSYLLTKSLSLW